MSVHGLFGENFLVVESHTLSADLYNGNPAGDVISLADFERICFLLHQKKSTSNLGTASFKPQAATSAAGSNAANIPFRWKKKTTGASSVWGDYTAVAAGSTGSTTANEQTIFQIEVEARDLPAGSKYVFLQLTEVVNDPVVGGVTAILYNHRHGFPFTIDPLA